MLNFSTTHAMIEQIFVEPSLDFPLSQNVLFDVLCDKDDLHDDIPMPPMMNDNAICALKSNTYADNKCVIQLVILMSCNYYLILILWVTLNLVFYALLVIWRTKFMHMMSCHGGLDIHIMLLEI